MAASVTIQPWSPQCPRACLSYERRGVRNVPPQNCHRMPMCSGDIPLPEQGRAQRGQVTHPRSHSGGPWHDIKPYRVRPQFPCSCHMKWKRRPHRSRFDWAIPGTPCMDLRQIGSTTGLAPSCPHVEAQRGPGGSKQAWSQGVDLHVTCMPGWTCSPDGGCRAGSGR